MMNKMAFPLEHTKEIIQLVMMGFFFMPFQAMAATLPRMCSLECASPSKGLGLCANIFKGKQGLYPGACLSRQS